MAERLTHPEEGTVFACPNCENSDVYRRQQNGGHNATVGENGQPIACYECGWAGSESDLDERPPKSPAVGGRAPKALQTPIGRALQRDDVTSVDDLPDDFGGDGLDA
jgi:predicted RNA-binding Zn-ribbon protein involved in translation (DUF1610 family)